MGGVVATTVAAPFDTLKSCVMADDGSEPKFVLCICEHTRWLRPH